jgi:hypothetical protein
MVKPRKPAVGKLSLFGQPTINPAITVQAMGKNNSAGMLKKRVTQSCWCAVMSRQWLKAYLSAVALGNPMKNRARRYR